MCNTAWCSGECDMCQYEAQEEKKRERFLNSNDDDDSDYHNNCRDDIKRNISEDKRKNAARNFGPNWANIMAGLGDQ